MQDGGRLSPVVDWSKLKTTPPEFYGVDDTMQNKVKTSLPSRSSSTSNEAEFGRFLN